MDPFLFAAGALLISVLFVVFFGAPYVPTLKKDILDIQQVRKLKKSDVFVDLGSGDGVVLRSVAPYCARAIGVELSPVLVLLSRLLNRSYPNTEVKLANIWSVELPPDTTVVYTFFNGKFMERIQRKLQAHVNTHGKTIDMITFGFDVKGKKPIKTARAMFLYRFTPLQK